MACALAKSAALQLQADAHSMPTQAAEHVLRTHLLSQPGPWDAGLVAVRVDTSSSSGSHSAASRSSSDDSSEGAAAQERGCDSQSASLQPATARSECAADTGTAGQQHTCEAAAVVAASCQPTAPAMPLTVRVEFVAAFTSPSFAVGYLARDGRQSVLSDVAVLRGSQAGATAAGGTATTPGPVESGSSASHQPPSVSSMEVSCSWPLQLMRP
jgi:hypothetical protein